MKVAGIRMQHAVDNLLEAAQELRDTEAKIEKDRLLLAKRVLQAYEAGVNYDDIARLINKSRIRTAQMIREERDRKLAKEA